jgi:hypothetical protein
MRAGAFFLSEFVEELNADLLLQVVALVDKAVGGTSGLNNEISWHTSKGRNTINLLKDEK